MKGEGIDPFLIRIPEVRDQLPTVGEAPQPIELVRLARNNVSKEWQSVCTKYLGQRHIAWMWSDL